MKQVLKSRENGMEEDFMETTKECIVMNDEFNENDTARYIKSYMFIKGFALVKICSRFWYLFL